MGSANSKSDDPGIITVVPAAPGSRGTSPLPFTTTSTSRAGSRAGSRPVTPCDPLLHHLHELQAQGVALAPAVSKGGLSTPQRSTHSSAPAAAAASSDPESLLGDIATVQQLSSDTKHLNEAISSLITQYQAWHAEQIKALTQNQDYIIRTMDQAEAKADKAVRHVQQQTIKLKQVSAGLAKAAELPNLLQQLTAATEALEAQLQLLEQRAEAATAATTGGSSSSSSSSSSAGVRQTVGSFYSKQDSSSSSLPQPATTGAREQAPQQQHQQHGLQQQEGASG